MKKMMTIQRFCEGIGLEETVSRQAVEFEIKEDTYQRYLRLFETDKEQFFQSLRAKENEHMFALALYIRMAADSYEKYRERQIADEIYFDTFSDIRIWSEACQRTYHVPGLMDYEWVSLPLELKIFRLGRLQFEPGKAEETVTAGENRILAGADVLHVHIPEGEPLDAEKCKESFRKAGEFFGDIYEAYICESWLLSPCLKELLPESANIIRFQRMFEVYQVVYPFRQAEERVFGRISEDKTKYPEGSSLQQALKKYVLTGKDPGMGKGIRFR